MAVSNASLDAAWLTTTATLLHTVTGSEQVTITLFNTDSSARTVTIWKNGTTDLHLERETANLSPRYTLAGRGQFADGDEIYGAASANSVVNYKIAITRLTP